MLPISALMILSVVFIAFLPQSKTFLVFCCLFLYIQHSSIPLFQSLKFPLSQFPDGDIVGQIEVKGGDRNMRIGHGCEIGISSLIKDPFPTTDPIVLPSPGIYLFRDGILAVDPSSLSGDLIGFDLLFIEVRNVDIEKGILGEPPLSNSLGHSYGKTGRWLKFEMAS